MRSSSATRCAAARSTRRSRWSDRRSSPTARPSSSERFIDPIRRGETLYCQLFSEPDAGSDLASLRTRAVRDGDDWVVTGQKIWTSGAHHADRAILLARTDPDASRHAGITYFLLDMAQPGIDVRPIVQINRARHFNEVYLDEVRVADADRLGRAGRGVEGGSHDPRCRAGDDRFDPRRRPRRPADRGGPRRRPQPTTPCSARSSPTCTSGPRCWATPATGCSARSAPAARSGPRRA